MNHEEYIAARYARLLEYAAELGCPDQDATDHVDRVLEEQRRQIAKAEDPDAGVREALARRIAGESEPRSTRWTYLSIAVALVLVAGGVVLWRPQDPQQVPVPSMFGFDVAAATRVLTDAGYDVATRSVAACEPRDLVLGTDPPPGTTTQRGVTVTLRTATPAGPGCLATYGFRSSAWQFIGFVRGEEAPDFAPSVSVFVDGDRLALLSARAAAGRRSWSEALALIERTATQVAPTRSAMPRLSVDSRVPPARLCGVPVPSSYGGRLALRLQIDPSPDGTNRLCPVTVDLYRDAERRIEAVSIYSGITQDVRTGS